MPVNAIILIIFFLVMLSVAVLYRGATLDRLDLQEGEAVMFEETGTRVEQSGSPRSVVFINCIVRVTDRRIIVAQKMLFRNKYALRHVIFYRQWDDDSGLKQTLLKGYILMHIDAGAMQVEQAAGEDAAVRIKIPATPLTGNQYIVFNTKRAEDYRKLLL